VGLGRKHPAHLFSRKPGGKASEQRQKPMLIVLHATSVGAFADPNAIFWLHFFLLDH
jgi:hypothetical protein